MLGIFDLLLLACIRASMPELQPLITQNMLVSWSIFNRSKLIAIKIKEQEIL